MRLIGRIAKVDPKFWAAEAPAIGVYTQGTSKNDAREMLADAIESVVNADGFKATVGEIEPEGLVFITFGDDGLVSLLAYLLKYQRARQDLSLADVAEKMGVSSRNNYAQYEQGKSVPSIVKLEELLKAVAPGLTITIDENSFNDRPANDTGERHAPKKSAAKKSVVARTR